MNKLRRILSVFAAFGILLSLTGCIRLAQEDGDLNGQDRFIGFSSLTNIWTFRS